VTGAEEVAGHGVAHETESEETEFCHRKRIVAPCLLTGSTPSRDRKGAFAV